VGRRLLVHDWLRGWAAGPGLPGTGAGAMTKKLNARAPNYAQHVGINAVPRASTSTELRILAVPDRGRTPLPP